MTAGGLHLCLPWPLRGCYRPLRLSRSLLRGVLTSCHGPCWQNGLLLWPQGLSVRITQVCRRQCFSGSRPYFLNSTSRGSTSVCIFSKLRMRCVLMLRVWEPPCWADALPELSLPVDLAEIGHRSPERLCDSTGHSTQISSQIRQRSRSPPPGRVPCPSLPPLPMGIKAPTIIS